MRLGIWTGGRAGRAGREANALPGSGPLALLALAALLGALSTLALAGAAGLAGSAGRVPIFERGVFAPPDQAPQYPSDRLFHLQHLRLDLAFDLRQRTVAGTATNVLTPLLPGLDHLVFHAAELHVVRVRLAGAAGDLGFTLDPAAQTLAVRLPRTYGPRDRLEVAIEYSARPRAGLYVVGPDRSYPDRPWELFSDGEPQLNRYWFPSWDEPDDRATSELLATVERPLEVIGNGRLVEVAERGDGRRTFHWLMEQPHSTYLVSVVAGEFSHLRDSWHGVAIDFYVPAALADRALRAFGHTADAMDFFSSVTGRPYPYAKYSQTAVYGYTWEGMENVSATTETVDTLRDERAALDATSDDLMAHELAHQWFGDLVTCRSWAHVWLNEGMATYFESLYRQHLAGALGDDELAWKLDVARLEYLREDRERYRRPLVTARYVDPLRMFDAHSYDKGALVVHMLRELVGEDGWWRGVHAYLERHALGTVASHDLEAAFEDTTGIDLRPLFEQFVYGAGHPELKVHWRHDPAAGVVRIEVRQIQQLDATTGLFSFPVEVALLDDRGAATVRRLALLARPSQELDLPSSTRPRTVVFDPRGVLLKTLDFDKPAAEWSEQLGAPLPLAARLDAARALGDLGGDEAVAALGGALQHDRFFGLRQVAAAALARIGSGPALAALRPGADDPDARVRAAALAGLGSFSDHPELIAPLARALESDASYGVRAAAAGALGRFDDRRRQVTPVLLRALAQRSHLEAVPRAALLALADLGAPEAFGQALRLARYGSPPAGRADAMLALATIARGGDAAQRRQARKVIEGYLADPEREVRAKAPGALAELGDAAAIPALESSLRAEVEDEQRRPRQEALRQLQEKSTKAAASQTLEDRVRQLERANEVLQEQLRELQQDRAATAPPSSAPPASAPGKPPRAHGRG